MDQSDNNDSNKKINEDEEENKDKWDTLIHIL